MCVSLFILLKVGRLVMYTDTYYSVLKCEFAIVTQQLVN